jgi:hypothetical protein
MGVSTRRTARSANWLRAGQRILPLTGHNASSSVVICRATWSGSRASKSRGIFAESGHKRRQAALLPRGIATPTIRAHHAKLEWGQAPDAYVYACPFGNRLPFPRHTLVDSSTKIALPLRWSRCESRHVLQAMPRSIRPPRHVAALAGGKGFQSGNMSPRLCRR